ncbi:MAG: hypothetical protein KGJ35_01090 [Patescibacteria group bacterium]|nr:hypothetical protein [Patescibacteria group bacterium]
MSSLTIPQRELALQLAQAGSEHPKALAKIALQFDISTVDAIDLAMTHCHPQKVTELLTKGLKVEQVCVIYDVVEYESFVTQKGSAARPSIRKLSDFAVWYLGIDFSEAELLEAIEAARRIFPPHWKHSDLDSVISYALGYGQALNNHSIQSVEALEDERFERRQAIEDGRPEEMIDYSDHGQGED